jgi:plastocyanin
MVVFMQKRWMLLSILLIAGIMVCGCTEKQNDIDTVSEEDVVSTSAVVRGEEHAIRMEHFGAMKPSELEINRGDVLVWRNYKKTGFYYLSSNDGLFEENEMKYGNAFEYMFEESGTYTFSVKDYPEMVLMVTVR